MSQPQTTSPADELRAAAAKIREIAAATSHTGPWKAVRWDVITESGPIADTEQPGDATHIATWHPLVALAVAAWLKDWSDLDPSERETRCGMCGDDHALTVARLILGTAS